MRVIFMGTPEFAVPALDGLVSAGHEIVLVVAQPDKPAGRGNQLRKPPVAERALAHGVPLIQPVAVRTPAFAEALRAANADVAVVIAYGRILTPEVLAIPTHGCINVHASLLPRWRGAAPIQASVLAGDDVTGVCTQRMEAGLDTGPVYLSAETAIEPHETAGELHDRLSEMSANLAVATLAMLSTLEPTAQDESQATWAPKISKDDGRVDLTAPAASLDRQIRAMTPWPGGFLPLASGPLKVLEVRVVPVTGEAVAPGTILSLDPLVVATGQDGLLLRVVQAPGKRPVRGSDYARGARLAVGGALS